MKGGKACKEGRAGFVHGMIVTNLHEGANTMSKIFTKTAYAKNAHHNKRDRASFREEEVLCGSLLFRNFDGTQIAR
jgi:hypothetical protein